MKISVLCHDGSPLGCSLKDLWGQGRRGIGLGGSEYALLTMCEQWTKEGHEVILYNDPIDATDNPFEQRSIERFNPSESPDVLIVFRSPHPKGAVSKAKRKVWWSCDQFTLPQFSFRDYAPHMDRIVLISKYHKKYFEDKYQIHNATVIDLPVRFQDFVDLEVKKVPNRMLFTSVPDRGLDYLWFIWPQIRRDIPDAELRITSDYRLWGSSSPNNQQHRMKWMSYEGVKFLGAIPRAQLLQEQAEAELLLYPSFYDTAELFCISVAEAQAMGVYPITSDWGALITTNMGTIINGRADQSAFQNQFKKAVQDFCDNRAILESAASMVKYAALDRFHPEIISKQWREKIFT
jgi:glycosyltransferase involved in cell wall biosynthesis